MIWMVVYWHRENYERYLQGASPYPVLAGRRWLPELPDTVMA
jgi:hypothetical protein